MTAIEMRTSLIRTLEVTAAERRVVEALLIDGADNETLARRAGVRVDTVKSHLRRVYMRLGVDNRCALVIELMSGRARMRTVPWRARPDQ